MPVFDELSQLNRLASALAVTEPAEAGMDMECSPSLG